jgi:hypothetical protein
VLRLRSWNRNRRKARRAFLNQRSRRSRGILPVVVFLLALTFIGFWLGIGYFESPLSRGGSLGGWLTRGASLLPFLEWTYEEPEEILSLPWSSGQEEGRNAGLVGRQVNASSKAYGPQAICAAGYRLNHIYVLDSCNKRIISLDSKEIGRVQKEGEIVGERGFRSFPLSCRGFPVSMALWPESRSSSGKMQDSLVVLTQTGEVLMPDPTRDGTYTIQFTASLGDRRGIREIQTGEEGAAGKAEARSTTNDPIVGGAGRVACLPDGSILVSDAWIEEGEYKQRLARYDLDGQIKNEIMYRVVRDDFGKGEPSWFLCDFTVGRGRDPLVYMISYQCQPARTAGQEGGGGLYQEEDGEDVAQRVSAGPPSLGNRIPSKTLIRIEALRFGLNRDETGAAKKQGYAQVERLATVESEAPFDFQSVGFLGVDINQDIYTGGFEGSELKWVMAVESGSIQGAMRSTGREDGNGSSAWMSQDLEKQPGRVNGGLLAGGSPESSMATGGGGGLCGPWWIGDRPDGGVSDGGWQSQKSGKSRETGIVSMAHPAIVMPGGDIIQMVSDDSGISVWRYAKRLKFKGIGRRE